MCMAQKDCNANHNPRPLDHGWNCFLVIFRNRICIIRKPHIHFPDAVHPNPALNHIPVKFFPKQLPFSTQNLPKLPAPKIDKWQSK